MTVSDLLNGNRRNSRHRKSAGGVSDDFIRNYVDLAFSLDTVVHGFFLNGVLCGAAELRPLGLRLPQQAEAAFSQEKAWRILHGDRASLSPRVEAWKIVGDNNAYQALPLNLDVSPTWLQQVGQLLEGVEVRGSWRFAWSHITSDMHHRGGAGSKSGNRRVNCEVRRLIYAQGVSRVGIGKILTNQDRDTSASLV